jgi:RNA polymerase sigma-70 factor (ECF subfamily)
MRWWWIALLGAALGKGRIASSATSGEADLDVADRLARGDADALAALYDRHARAVFSLALRILGEQADAEDVLQEVFAQAWRQAGRYDARRGRPLAWLLNMTRSRAIDHLRRRRDVPTFDGTLPDLPADAPGADAAAMTAADTRALRAALAALPALQRAAIELAYFEGLSQSEIAARLEQPLGTVKTRVRLGLLKLREAMGGSEP